MKTKPLTLSKTLRDAIALRYLKDRTIYTVEQCTEAAIAEFEGRATRTNIEVQCKYAESIVTMLKAAK